MKKPVGSGKVKQDYIRMATSATSTSFKKGQSGNPKGRPKREWTIAGLIEDALEEQDQFGTPWKKVMIDKLVSLAGSGDMVAIKEVNQRIDGMPQQVTDVTSGGKPIPIVSVRLRNDLLPDDSLRETLETDQEN